jgi:Lon protease-like protein
MDVRHDDPFPPGERRLQWQAELEADAAERERELQQILERVAARTHTPQDGQRLVRELDIAWTAT